jgi:type II secretory pathway pseudopilin PulG
MRMSNRLQLRTIRPAGGWRCHHANVATVARRWMNHLSTSNHHTASGYGHPRFIHALASVATSHHALASVATRRDRSAVTLLELLIVMGLLTLLASISLTAARGLMRGNKVAEAATIVQQYLQNAQVRAITNGRPVAVFLDRVSPAGDLNGNPVPANYTVNRLQLGEVFPPYMGDELETFGQLLPLSVAPPNNHLGSKLRFIPQPPPPAPPIPNSSIKVASGFGFFQSGNFVQGFITVGDSIEIEGTPVLFEILNIIPNPTGSVAGTIDVEFSNSISGTWSSNKGQMAKQLGINSDATVMRRFKIYRQPTKSLAGSVSLPRGACIDLSVSGLGIDNNAADGNLFSIASAPSNVGNSDFSRVAIVFDAQGKLSYLMDETSTRTPPRIMYPAPSMLYLMIGRTDQVLPGMSGNPIKLQALQPADTGELPPGNLLDSENVWITCNPFTGEVKSSPVAAIDPTDLDDVRDAIARNASEVIEPIVRRTRRLAAAGMRN